MGRKISEEFLNRILNKIIDKKRIFSAILCVENGDGSFSWTGAAGNMKEDSRFFIASVTKLYVTAVTMMLIDENRLSLNDKLSTYLPASLCKGIHILKGVDYSDELSVLHLLSNTSGLPDYFFHKQADGRTAADWLLDGNDDIWYPEKTMELVKQLKPKFSPGAKGKAAYSDTNYQLLGIIIEKVTGKSMGEVFDHYIFSELNLKNTYAYKNDGDTSPAPFYYKTKQLWLPQYIASVTAEGGIVSTAGELMLFLKEFFNGRFFPKEKIEDLKKWNLILPPPGLFFFGIGLEKLWTPWIVSPLKPVREIIGFWGQTGSFAFYHADTDLYFCGTTNQVNGDGHRAAVNAMLKVIKSQQNGFC